MTAAEGKSSEAERREAGPSGGGKALLLVAGEARELRGILRRCARVENPAWPVAFARRGELNGNRLVMVADGPGKLAAAAAVAVLDRVAVDAVVSVGFCGALDPALRTGDIFIPARVSGPAGVFATRAAGARSELMTRERVALTREEKRALRAAGAGAVDMEAALVAAAAAARDVPFHAVRAVMDRAEESFTLDFNDLRDGDGRFDRGRIALAALVRPLRAIPELVRIARQDRKASRALGDFFAACRF